MEKAHIFNANGEILISMINNFLLELDNNMQFATDSGKENLAYEISADYNQIEKIYWKAKKDSIISKEERSFIRSTMTHNLKLSAEFIN